MKSRAETSNASVIARMLERLSDGYEATNVQYTTLSSRSLSIQPLTNIVVTRSVVNKGSICGLD